MCMLMNDQSFKWSHAGMACHQNQLFNPTLDPLNNATITPPPALLA